MTARVAVLTPVLDRPHRVAPLVASLADSSRFIPCEPWFICSPGDGAQIAALIDAGVPYQSVSWKPDVGDYARKINWGARRAVKAGAEFVFLGADDLVFHPGWIERALACHLETHACVVGTNDLGHSGTQNGVHSTHTLVHRDYLECGTIDEPDSGKLLHESYDHWMVDPEFVGTAMFRETWAHATDSLVEHLHPTWKKSSDDATYRKGQRAVAADRALYDARRRLWEPV